MRTGLHLLKQFRASRKFGKIDREKNFLRFWVRRNAAGFVVSYTSEQTRKLFFERDDNDDVRKRYFRETVVEKKLKKAKDTSTSTNFSSSKWIKFHEWKLGWCEILFRSETFFIWLASGVLFFYQDFKVAETHKWNLYKSSEW